MGLLEEWRTTAYNQEEAPETLQKFWDAYFAVEKGIYEQLLADPKTEVKGTVKELADRYKTDVMTMVGCLDGIDESLITPNPIADNLTEDTVCSLAFDTGRLYKNMVDAEADWLYNLPQWDAIYSKEEQKKLYLEQKKSHTVVKGKKIGRNDPCPCGSGKKYKNCCGRNK